MDSFELPLVSVDSYLDSLNEGVLDKDKMKRLKDVEHKKEFIWKLICVRVCVCDIQIYFPRSFFHGK